MKGMSALGVIIALVVAAIVGGAFFTVKEHEQVVITRFGQPRGSAVATAGLHMKVPFLDKANYFDKRILEWDGKPTQIPTQDKKFILIDETARWRIQDPLLFFQSMNNEMGAQRRLNDIIASATRDVVTNHTLQEVVRTTNRLLDEPAVSDEDLGEDSIESEEVDRIRRGRKELTRLIMERAKELTPKYGIEIVDMRIKRINYIEAVRQKVYERMISERRRAAEKYRSEGQGRRAEIEGQMEKELQLITSEATRRGLEIRGKADAEATAIYAEAFNKDPEFYGFLRTLETYGKSIDGNSILLLSTGSDYFSLLKSLNSN